MTKNQQGRLIFTLTADLVPGEGGEPGARADDGNTRGNTMTFGPGRRATTDVASTAAPPAPAAWEVDEVRPGGLVMVALPVGSDDHFGLVCPICGFDYMHIADVQRVTETRNILTHIAFWAECGHRMTTTLDECKGLLYVTTRRNPDAETLEGL